MTTPSLGDDAPDYDAALPGAETELAPSALDTEAHTAWALDDGPEWKPPFWTPARITGVAVGVAALTIVIVAGLVGYHLRTTPLQVAAPAPTTSAPAVQLPTTTSPTPVVITTTTTTTPAPPETVTVTRQALPAPRTDLAAAPGMPTNSVYPESQLQISDEQFVSRLRATGWIVYDVPGMKMTGRNICVEFSQGESLYGVQQKLHQIGYSMVDAVTAAAIAQMVYPDCLPK